MPSLYLSHSTLDKEFAERLADDLKRAGVDIRHGEDKADRRAEHRNDGMFKLKSRAAAEFTKAVFRVWRAPGFGAQNGDIVRLVVSHGRKLAVTGLAMGI